MPRADRAANALQRKLPGAALSPLQHNTTLTL
jgi:hypothetical protein